MSPPKLSQHDFVRLFEEIGAQKLANRLKITVRSVYTRRKAIEGSIGRNIRPPTDHGPPRVGEHPHRLHLGVTDGCVLVGSDAHYWPGPASTAHRAFVKFIKTLKPKHVIMNGDALDAARISRHPPIGWEKRPSLVDEVEACKEHLHEIEKVSRNGMRRIWTLGNHDARFETRLATVAPEYAMLHGVHLKDHFPLWEPCWSCWINTDVVVKHRFKGGMHAPQNNTLWSGKTTITGHLHSAKVQPITDYNGTRYGVDTGCLADTDAQTFVDYTEDNPKNWRSAFCVLTFQGGLLLQPELVLVWGKDHVQFRGEIIGV